MEKMAVKIENVSKFFGKEKVLDDINLSVKAGEKAALIGPSGSGKTTLIRAINGFVIPDAGKIYFNGALVNYKNKKNLRDVRKRIGKVYQQFNLVERLTAVENVLTGALGRYDRLLDSFLAFWGIFKKEDKEIAFELLRYVGLEDKYDQRVDKLSGGQKQRVAIARALMQDAELILADEPISNLDPKTSRRIIELLLRINHEKGKTLICILHHIDGVIEDFDRVVALRKGKVFFDGPPSQFSKDLYRELYGMSEES